MYLITKSLCFARLEKEKKELPCKLDNAKQENKRLCERRQELKDANEQLEITRAQLFCDRSCISSLPSSVSTLCEDDEEREFSELFKSELVLSKAGKTKVATGKEHATDQTSGMEDCIATCLSMLAFQDSMTELEFLAIALIFVKVLLCDMAIPKCFCLL